MTTPNPLHLANSAQQMARTAPACDAAIFFNKVAMISMGVMAAASVVQMLQPLLRDLNGKHDKHAPDTDRGKGR
jgi:hypothetical protein